MARRLPRSKMHDVDHHLRRAHAAIHDLIDDGPKHKHVTASYLKFLAKQLRETSAALDYLASSPFIGEDAAPHLQLAEPHALGVSSARDGINGGQDVLR